jgi:N-acetylmuramoyl-L-alanine amidase
MVLLLLIGAPWCAGAAPRFHTEQANGRNYVKLRDFAAYYGFGKKWTRNKKIITLRKKYNSLQLKLDSREAVITREGESVRLHLGYPPLDDGGTILIPESDVIKTFDPVLRPWALPEFKVSTIMLDPGHGGLDKGTLGVSPGVMEKTYALDTTKRVERFLRAAGYRTVMTRRQDEYVSLEDRAEQANVSSAEIFVSIHYNSAKPSRGPNGVETYCLTPAAAPSTGKSRPTMSDYQTHPGNRRDAHNMLLAYCVQHAMLKNVQVTDRGVKRARFVVIKETRRPAILVECGFLSNAAELARIRTPAHREKLAKAISQGIIDFIRHVRPK